MFNALAPQFNEEYLHDSAKQQVNASNARVKRTAALAKDKADAQAQNGWNPLTGGTKGTDSVDSASLAAAAYGAGSQIQAKLDKGKAAVEEVAAAGRKAAGDAGSVLEKAKAVIRNPTSLLRNPFTSKIAKPGGLSSIVDTSKVGAAPVPYQQVSSRASNYDFHDMDTMQAGRPTATPAFTKSNVAAPAPEMPEAATTNTTTPGNVSADAPATTEITTSATKDVTQAGEDATSLAKDAATGNQLTVKGLGKVFKAAKTGEGFSAVKDAVKAGSVIDKFSGAMNVGTVANGVYDEVTGKEKGKSWESQAGTIASTVGSALDVIGLPEVGVLGDIAGGVLGLVGEHEDHEKKLAAQATAVTAAKAIKSATPMAGNTNIAMVSAPTAAPQQSGASF